MNQAIVTPKEIVQIAAQWINVHFNLKIKNLTVSIIINLSKIK